MEGHSSQMGVFEFTKHVLDNYERSTTGEALCVLESILTTLRAILEIDKKILEVITASGEVTSVSLSLGKPEEQP